MKLEVRVEWYMLIRFRVGKKLKANEKVRNTTLVGVFINCQRFEENYMGYWSMNFISDLLKKKQSWNLSL